MAIDIRATVTCSLGTLISASLSDDYVQGTGLIKCKGSCEISGTITPAIGTVVTFSYTKGGVTTQVPRKLRVLSSFADPFRRTTKVELGCKLTYLQDLQEPVKWEAFDDDENNDLTEDDAKIITIPIHASSVANKCLTELGITASSVPLTNKFSIAEFDFGAGYVSILSDLLVSESYCGYLDTNEVLQVLSLDQEGGTGPVLSSTNIIDIGPIGVGQLPGEAVTVSYSSLKLKGADDTGNEPWVYSVTRGPEQSIVIRYDYNGETVSREYQYAPVTITRTEYEDGGERRITKQTSLKYTIAAEAGANYLSQVAAAIGDFDPDLNPGEQIVESTITQYEYDLDGQIKVELPSNGPYPGGWYYTAGKTTRTTTITLESELRIVSALNLPFAFGDSYVELSTNLLGTQRIVTVDEDVSGYSRSVTDSYRIYGATQEGQQAVAAASETLTSVEDVTTFIGKLLANNLVLEGSSVDIRYGESRLNNRMPPAADVINAKTADGGDPANGYRTESKAELELALGSATAQRRIELNLPYAPDDTFIKTGSTYLTVKSDAAAKANRYGRCQNRLLLGNRNGMNVQIAPESLPDAPFAPVVVQANGLSALYRTNGTSYTMDASGIVVSSDLLFWGAVGGTGTFWFPVAPGITTLPSTPAVVDGEMTVSSVVPAYNETVLANARTRSTLVVTAFSYALELLTEAAITSRSTLTAVTIIAVKPATIDVVLVALTPVVSTGAAVAVPALNAAVEAAAPVVVGGASVAVPAAEMLVAGLDLDEAGPVTTRILAPAAQLLVNGAVPDIAGGASVTLPSTAFGVEVIPPVVVKTYRYIRMKDFAGTALASNTFDLTEIELWSGDEQLTGLTVSASFTLSGAVSNIVDGVVATTSRAYRSNFEPIRATAYLDFDLGSGKTVTHIRVTSLFAQPRFPVSFTLSGSNTAGSGFGATTTVTVGDATAWTLLATSVYQSEKVPVEVP